MEIGSQKCSLNDMLNAPACKTGLPSAGASAITYAPAFKITRQPIRLSPLLKYTSGSLTHCKRPLQSAKGASAHLEPDVVAHKKRPALQLSLRAQGFEGRHQTCQRDRFLSAM